MCNKIYLAKQFEPLVSIENNGQFFIDLGQELSTIKIETVKFKLPDIYI